MKSNTLCHAERELGILVKSNLDPDNRPIIEPFIPEILALVEKFGQSGQSGGSAPYTAAAISQAVKTLCLKDPLCPIMGIDEEWNNVSELGNGSDKILQNNRCSAIFKENDGKPHYLDAVVWKTEAGVTWSGRAKLTSGATAWSRQYVKSFPFKPKTFIVDVIEHEVAPGDWEFTVKDEAQLKEVYEYYDQYTEKE